MHIHRTKAHDMSKKSKTEHDIQQTVQLGNEDQPTKENESHNCKFCGSPKNSPEDVIKHCFAEHNYCLECEKKFQSLSDAIHHMNSIHVTRLKCYLCNFSTLDHTLLKAHEESHGTSQVKTYSEVPHTQ